MKKMLILCLILALALLSVSCSRRMAPFSPHRSSSEAHLVAQDNAACVECHDVTTKGPDNHQASDDCMRCHRILQGG